ncbi:mycothiol transferase [Micromonospora haikouensis]|uniref:mycothiol transferase n=1 Tax=Micromonospora haikouensis TaxID=686309 RepID=UPI003D7097F8
MEISEVLTETYGRLPALVRAAVDGLSPEQLRRAPAPGANPVGWLVWHLTRVQDHHVADLLDAEQLWMTGDWAARFGLSADPDDTGYAHTPDQVAAVAPESPRVLVDYHDAVAERTRGFLAGLRPADLDRVVDEAWDPPVTLGVRLVSIAEDDLQHVGQAAYVRGLLLTGR